MKVITETELRDYYKQAEFTSFRLPAGTRLTPSAQQFLSERRIEVITAERNSTKNVTERGNFCAGNTGAGSKPGVANAESEAKKKPAANDELSAKPEHMTHICAGSLVNKGHPRIKFRGKLDSFEAFVINAILEVRVCGHHDLAADLEQLLEYSRQVMRAEVKEEFLAPPEYKGLNHQDIREHSHHPEKFYGIGHFVPSPRQGKIMAQLNLLRTQGRELELAAIEVFYEAGEGQGRPDILQALNRLSSLIYIMMLQVVSGRYQVG